MKTLDDLVDVINVEHTPPQDRLVIEDDAGRLFEVTEIRKNDGKLVLVVGAELVESQRL